jgi:hypothetical protein
MFYGVNMAIGSRILERLTALNWKRNDLLARVPDLTPQALSNLIRRDSVRSEWDEAIATALGVSVLWLVYGQADYIASGNITQMQTREPAPPPFPLDQIISAANNLSREGQLIAVGRLQEMAAQYPKAKPNIAG